MSLRAKKLLQMAISIAILAFFASYLDWPSIVSFFHRANGWILLGLIALFPIDRLFMAWKWFLLVRKQPSPISFWDAARIYLASSAIGLLLPLGGLGPDVARVAMLSRQGMSADISVPSILVERLSGVVSALLMLVVSTMLMLLLMQDQAAGSLRRFVVMFAQAGAAVIVLLALSFLLARNRRVIGVFRRLRTRLKVDKYVDAIRWYADQPALLLVSVALAWIEQWAPIFAFYLACRGFDVPLSLLQCAAIVPLASILERLPISFAGLGVREAGLVFGAGWFAVSSADAFLVALTQQALYMLTILPLGLLYFVRPKELEAAAPPKGL